MKLTIQNEIHFGDETELIHEVHDCDFVSKGDFHYLTYTNDEQEKVMMKFNQEQMTMTRFSSPKSIMRFHRKEPAVVAIPTPLGIQQLKTETSHFKADMTEQHLAIHYALKQLEGDGTFANYRLKLSWK